jgi:two-component system, LytTR family, sensor kinase
VSGDTRALSPSFTEASGGRARGSGHLPRIEWRITGLLCAFWAVCAVLSTAGLWTTLQLGTVRMQGGDASIGGLIRLQAVPWLATAILTPVVVAWSVALARRAGWTAVLAAHTVGLLVFAVADTALTVWLHLLQPRGDARFTLSALTGRLASAAVLLTIKYACIVLVTSAFLFLQRAAAARAHADGLSRARLELERDLAATRLMVLRQQLQPHFLFNAPNAVSGLIEPDPPRAQRLLVELSDLLRLALRQSTAADATLSDELDFADRYLAVERARLGDRLRVAYDVDQDLLGARLPSFTVQPLVENAVRHGIARRLDGGTVEVSVRRVTGALEVRVTNDADAAVTPGEDGTGLASLRARLSGMYGDRAALDARAADGRFTAVVTVPVEAA